MMVANGYRIQKFDSDWTKLKKFLLSQKETLEDNPNHPEWVEQNRKEIISGTMRTYVVTQKDEIVGDIIFKIQKDIEENWLMNVHNLYITHSSRNQSLGAILIKIAEVEAKIQGMKAIELDCTVEDLETGTCKCYKNILESS